MTKYGEEDHVEGVVAIGLPTWAKRQDEHGRFKDVPDMLTEHYPGAVAWIEELAKQRHACAFCGASDEDRSLTLIGGCTSHFALTLCPLCVGHVIVPMMMSLPLNIRMCLTERAVDATLEQTVNAEFGAQVKATAQA